MNCNEYRVLLDRLLDGEATPADLEAMALHEAECPECAALRAELEALTADLGPALDDVPPMPEDLHGAWVEAVRRDADETARAESDAGNRAAGNVTDLNRIRRRKHMRWLSAAAAALFILGGTLLTWDQLDDAPVSRWLKAGRTPKPAVTAAAPRETASAAPAAKEDARKSAATATAQPTAKPAPATTDAPTPAPEDVSGVFGGLAAQTSGMNSLGPRPDSASSAESAQEAATAEEAPAAEDEAIAFEILNEDLPCVVITEDACEEAPAEALTTEAPAEVWQPMEAAEAFIAEEAAPAGEPDWAWDEVAPVEEEAVAEEEAPAAEADQAWDDPAVEEAPAGEPDWARDEVAEETAPVEEAVPAEEEASAEEAAEEQAAEEPVREEAPEEGETPDKPEPESADESAADEPEPEKTSAPVLWVSLGIQTASWDDTLTRLAELKTAFGAEGNIPQPGGAVASGGRSVRLYLTVPAAALEEFLGEAQKLGQAGRVDRSAGVAEAEGPVPVYINLQETAGEAPAANTAVRAAVEKEAGGAAEFFRRMGLFILNALPWLAGAGVLIGAVIFLRRRGKKR